METALSQEELEFLQLFGLSGMQPMSFSTLHVYSGESVEKVLYMLGWARQEGFVKVVTENEHINEADVPTNKYNTYYLVEEVWDQVFPDD